MDEEDAQEFYERLSERIALLEQKNDRLLQDSKLIEGEKRFIQSELGKLRREGKRLKSELDRLKSPPLIIGVIRDILVDGRMVVKSTTGPDFIVQAADYVDPDSLVVGSRVALNKQTLAVMGVLPPSYDPIVIGAEVIEKPPITY
ncbi:MAG: proteasome-activating nucleotidase, partial [Thermoplasmata archaeon]